MELHHSVEIRTFLWPLQISEGTHPNLIQTEYREKKREIKLLPYLPRGSLLHRWSVLVVCNWSNQEAVLVASDLCQQVLYIVRLDSAVCCRPMKDGLWPGPFLVPWGTCRVTVHRPDACAIFSHVVFVFIQCLSPSEPKRLVLLVALHVYRCLCVHMLACYQLFSSWLVIRPWSAILWWPVCPISGTNIGCFHHSTACTVWSLVR